MRKRRPRRTRYQYGALPAETSLSFTQDKKTVSSRNRRDEGDTKKQGRKRGVLLPKGKLWCWFKKTLEDRVTQARGVKRKKQRERKWETMMTPKKKKNPLGCWGENGEPGNEEKGKREDHYRTTEKRHAKKSRNFLES